MPTSKRPQFLDKYAIPQRHFSFEASPFGYLNGDQLMRAGPEALLEIKKKVLKIIEGDQYDSHTKLLAISSPIADMDSLALALKLDNALLREAVMKREDLTIEVLTAAIENPDPIIKKMAVLHVNADESVWRRGLQDEDPDVVNAAERRMADRP